MLNCHMYTIIFLLFILFALFVVSYLLSRAYHFVLGLLVYDTKFFEVLKYSLEQYTGFVGRQAFIHYFIT